MAYRPTSFSPLRQPKGETTEQVGARLDRVQDNIRTQFDPLSKAVAALASSGTGGGGADLSDTPALALSTSAQAGTSDEASRSDHRHPFPSGSQLWTRQEVTTATAISGTGNIYVAITASFDGAITLPAATTAKQTIVITDEAGVGSGDANGASENIIYVEVDDTGTETITAPGLATARTRLMLWKRYGTITLVSEGTSSWRATERAYWHIDPRTVSGLKCWYDARRGITLNGTTVSAWADISGNNIDVAQATAADQPLYLYSANESRSMHGDHNAVIALSSDHLVSSSSPVFNSGALTVFAAFDYDFSRSPGTEIMFRSALAAGLGFFWSVNSSATPGGAAAGNAYIAANNAAVTSYSSVSRNLGANGGIDSHVQWVALRAVQSGGKNYRTPQGGSTSRAASGAVSAFTQTIRVFDTIEQCRVGHLMAFDADLSVADIADIESALIEVWPRG